MIGSKNRVHNVKKELLKKGVDPKKIERIYTPIGLEIMAETPVDMTGQDAEEDGMVCGGVIEVFLEKIS